MKTAIIPVIFLGLILFACQSDQTNNSVVAEGETADSLALKATDLIHKYQEWEIFSGVVLMAREGKPFFHEAYGLADRQSNKPNTINTLFDIGSMNKTFTKVIIGL